MDDDRIHMKAWKCEVSNDYWGDQGLGGEIEGRWKTKSRERVDTNTTEVLMGG